MLPPEPGSGYGEDLVSSLPVAELIIRGEIFTDHLVEMGGRDGDLRFSAPDIRQYLGKIPLGNPAKLLDLQRLSLSDILTYLERLGTHLDVATNPHMARARQLSYLAAPTTKPIVDASYDQLKSMFARDVVLENIERNIGVRYLEGWVEERMLSGATVGVRCFGARCLHIVAGNHPSVTAASILRSAILRCDAIIKTPSNDPFTAVAIARTMCEMAPDHPLTKHLTVAYWKGGDANIEERLYQPHNIEKIIAWGGFSSVKHVTRHIQPGLELIALDPKRSVSFVGSEAFASDDSLAEVAARIAADFGGMNQVACSNARVIYVLSGSDKEGIGRLEKLGQCVYDALLGLPESISTKPKHYDRELRSYVEAARLDDDAFTVFGGKEGEGAVIVSRMPEPIDFATRLNDRTANLVPVDNLDGFLGAVNSYTQTVGIYPDSLKIRLQDILPVFGAQRLVSLGYAIAGSFSTPQDGIEPLRRMGKWVTSETFDPDSSPGPWVRTEVQAPGPHKKT